MACKPQLCFRFQVFLEWPDAIIDVRIWLKNIITVIYVYIIDWQILSVVHSLLTPKSFDFHGDCNLKWWSFSHRSDYNLAACVYYLIANTIDYESSTLKLVINTLWPGIYISSIICTKLYQWYSIIIIQLIKWDWRTQLLQTIEISKHL